LPKPVSVQNTCDSGRETHAEISDIRAGPPTRDDQRSRRRAGLAKGTVSRALNGYPDIAEATQLRVRRAAERMGYRPMAQAQAIRTGARARWGWC
jgi:hypothetical protein